METFLSIQGLKKSYDGSTLALKGISLEFTEGEFVVVIGPSGSGKSTFIRCIDRLIDPTEGSITFEGQAVEKLRGRALRSLRSRIGMIFQNYNLVGRTNVLMFVLEGLM